MTKNFLEDYFYNPTQGQMLFSNVIKELIGYIKSKPKDHYEIIVGCDSSSSQSPNFCVVITILRIGKRGRFFIKKIDYSKIKEKIFYN